MMALGRGQKRFERSKAHPDEFPGHGHVELKKAFEELSSSAFALWLRISGEREALRSGRSAIAKLTGFSQRRISELMLELERKGYVGFSPGGGPIPDGIVIHRRCVIGADAGVVRLSA
jgi:hypothetical protein